MNFGNKGYSTSVPIYGSHAVFQPDGKIVVVGYTINSEQYFYNYKDFAVARFNADGSLDNTFDGDGITATDFNDNDVANAVAIQPDGKIIVVGDIFDDADDRTFFGMARYNPDGSLDETLNGNGKQKTDVSANSESAKAVAIQSDGNVVVAGDVFNGDNFDFVIVRFDPNGNLDNTFAGVGTQYTGFGSADDRANSLAIQPDGKIIISGSSPDNFELARYNTDGTLDNSFDGDGKQTINFGDVFINETSMVLQRDGKILLAGFTGDDDNNSFAVARFKSNGALDKSFAGDGRETTGFGTMNIINSLALQNDGKVIALGYTSDRNNSLVAAARYNSDGTLDDSFDGDGKLTEQVRQGSTAFTSTAIQPDGKVLAAGYTWNGSNYDFAVVRYNTDGSFDNTFSIDGKQTTDFGTSDDKIRDVTLQSDGKIVVAGSAGDKFALARYNADGTLDNGFSLDGRQTTNFGSSDSITSLAIQNDGKILAAGTALVRYNTNGSLDNSFSGDGKLTTPFTCGDVAIQTDGKIIIAGDGTVARYNANGTIDNTFGDNGEKIIIDELNPNFREDYNLFCKSIAIQNDGKIVIGGYYEHNYRGTTSSFAVVRLNSDGSADNSFNEDGLVFTYPGSSLLDYGTSLLIQEDNKIILGGYAYNGSSDDFALVRYNADGSLDNTLNDDGILITPASTNYDRIADIAIADNKLYAAGFGQYPGNFGVIARYLLSSGGPLPVTLSGFNASVQNNTSVLLTWQTANEQNVVKFVIEHSTDGNTFLPIGIENAKGMSNSVLNYSTVDKQPLNGLNFYRLKMIDGDGNIRYSKIVTANISNEVFNFTLFPNPAIDVLYVQANGNNEKATFIINDAGGRKLKELNVTLNGNTSFSFNVNALPKGTYTLQLHTKVKSETKRFIKE